MMAIKNGRMLMVSPVDPWLRAATVLNANGNISAAAALFVISSVAIKVTKYTIPSAIQGFSPA